MFADIVANVNVWGLLVTGAFFVALVILYCHMFHDRDFDNLDDF